MRSKILKITTLTLLISTFLYSGCDKKELDLLPTVPTESDYFKTEADFNRQSIGVYAKISDFYQYRGGQFNTIVGLFFLPGDDITTNNPGEDVEIFANLQPSGDKTSVLWNRAYQLISRANVVLEQIEIVKPGVFSDVAVQNNIKGEALFLRGFAYYYLWNYFGTAPLRNKRVVSEADFKPFPTKNTELLDQAISDFTEAAVLLPESWNSANKGRAFKNSANGFLGKCLVFRASVTKNNADYLAAITAFNKITAISSLVSDFKDNFSDVSENNSESLFEYQAGNAAQGNNVWLDNDFNNDIGDLSMYWGYYSNHWSLFSSSRYFVTTKLASAFEPGDPREGETLEASDRTVTKFVKQDISAVGPGSFNNYRILRLADIKLLQAEAVLQSGGSTSDAVALVNEVRTRARGAGLIPANYSTSESNKTTIMDWIMKERFVELAGEGQRWFDLRRWHIQGLITLNNSFFSSNTGVAFEAPKNLYFPIPSSELDANPNMVQNKDY